MRRAVIVTALLLAGAMPVRAQSYRPDGPHRGSVEIGGSGTWSAGYDAGERDATETSNSSSGAPPLTLFTTSSTVLSGLGADARFGIYVASRVSLEASLQYSRPVLQTSIRDDFENAAPIEARDTVSSYIAAGSVLFHFGTDGVVPFVAAGAGYVRQLHEGNGGVLTGTEVHGGGGVKIWLGGGARRFGLRIDAQASSRDKSVGFEQKRRIVPIVGVGVSYVF